MNAATWCHATAECQICTNRWEAVFEIFTDCTVLECPSCGARDSCLIAGGDGDE